MIANSIELHVAIRNLNIVMSALEALRLDMKVRNPELFPIVSQTYLRRIRDLQNEILAYYADHSTEYARNEEPVPEAIRESGAAYTTSEPTVFVVHNSTAEWRKLMEELSREQLPNTPPWASTEDGAEGVKFGILLSMMKMAGVIMRKRFGAISTELQQRLNSMTLQQPEDLGEQLLDFTSASELLERLDRI